MTQLSPANVPVGVGEPDEGFVDVAVGDPFGVGGPGLDGDFVGDALGCAVGDNEVIPDGEGVGNVPGK